MNRAEGMGVGWGAREGGASIDSVLGSVVVMNLHEAFPGMGIRSAEVLDDEAEWFPSLVERRGNRYGRGIAVPHWFLILLFLVPWSGWLAWRWRKIKRFSIPGT